MLEMLIPKKRKLSSGSDYRGAQMGRRNYLPDDPKISIVMRLELLPWVDGDYDEGGAYWGSCKPNTEFVYWAYGEDAENQCECFVRATSREDAMDEVWNLIPGAEFCPLQPEDIDDFTQGYITCMLWSEYDQSDERGGNPLEDNYQQCDIAPATLLKIITDCQKFQQKNATWLEKAHYPKKDSSDMAHAGHDFWLTRAESGAGFGDGDLPDEVDDALRQACDDWPAFEVYTHEGKIHHV